MCRVWLWQSLKSPPSAQPPNLLSDETVAVANQRKCCACGLLWIWDEVLVVWWANHVTQPYEELHDYRVELVCIRVSLTLATDTLCRRWSQLRGWAVVILRKAWNPLTKKPKVQGFYLQKRTLWFPNVQIWPALLSYRWKSNARSCLTLYFKYKALVALGIIYFTHCAEKCFSYWQPHSWFDWEK